MADLDNTSKRRSSVQILVPSTLAPLLPDGAIAQADRQHIAISYSGILAAAPGGGIYHPIFSNDISGVIFGGKVVS